MNSVADAGSASVERLLNLRPKGVGVSIKFASREPRGLRGHLGTTFWQVGCHLWLGRWQQVLASLQQVLTSLEVFIKLGMQVLVYVKIMWHVEDTGIAFGNTFYGYEEILLFQQGCRNCRKTLGKFAAELGPF